MRTEHENVSKIVLGSLPRDKMAECKECVNKKTESNRDVLVLMTEKHLVLATIETMT